MVYLSFLFTILNRKHFYIYMCMWYICACLHIVGTHICYCTGMCEHMCEASRWMLTVFLITLLFCFVLFLETRSLTESDACWFWLFKLASLPYLCLLSTRITVSYHICLVWVLGIQTPVLMLLWQAHYCAVPSFRKALWTWICWQTSSHEYWFNKYSWRI